jgi:RNA polymerase sigma-70 factor (ECF subfamily)
MARVETRESSWSFDQIYDEYKIPIYNYVYHLVGDREQADDLTQDTFLKAFRALPKMDANLKLSAWLYRIATNTAYDALRRRKLIAWLPWQDLDHDIWDNRVGTRRPSPHAPAVSGRTTSVYSGRVLL